MEPVIEKVGQLGNRSFHVEHNVVKYFTSQWHFHKAFEIILICRGTGNGFIGDSIHRFNENTLALLGTELPHVWLNDKKFYNPEYLEQAESYVIKFHREFLGDHFFHSPELFRINHLLERASRGILFNQEFTTSLTPLVQKIVQNEGLLSLTSLLELLELMALEADVQYMASEGYRFKYDNADCERLDKVYKYVLENYSKPISLEKVSEVASFTPTAFCRFFKSRTNKTFSQFLNEVRISNACRMIIARKYSISEIGYKAGFNYQSNFHKQFKTIMGMTPQDYQRKYWESQSKIEV